MTRRPPILLTRPLYEWINRVGQKHKQFAALDLDAEEQKVIQRRIEIDFVCSAIRLEGADVQEAQVARMISEIESSGLSASEQLIVDQLKAFRVIEALARQENTITPESLLKIRDRQEFRSGEGATDQMIRPPRPEHLIASIQSVCFWFSAESFLELNPVEQAAIAFLRLIEIQPFDDRNDSTAIAAASFFLLRSQLPPLIIRADQIPAYRSAIIESRQSNTRPMVELIAEATEKTLTEMIAIIVARR